MSARKRWPTDQAWRIFAARIADGVTLHLSSGGKITQPWPAGPGCKCPLGAAIRSADCPFPAAAFAAGMLDVDPAWTRSFADGFDDTSLQILTDHAPSFLLGRAYRRWSLERAS